MQTRERSEHEQSPSTPWHHAYARVDGLRLHYVHVGHGPPVVLLHGFPEHWYAWRHQLPALAAGGFHAVAPDMRGFNLSDKPKGVRAYALERLAGDVEGLLDHLEVSRAHLVGHDWGGAVAQAFAMRHPERVQSLALLNMPHLPRFAAALRKPSQVKRSWYIFFFQLPWLPEAASRAKDFAALRALLRDDPVRADAFDDEAIQRYVDAMAQPGALTATLSYYRAMLRHPFLRMKRIEAPTCIIWGERDRVFLNTLAEPHRRWMPHATVHRLADASHWVQADRPQRVNELLLEHLSTHTG